MRCNTARFFLLLWSVISVIPIVMCLSEASIFQMPLHKSFPDIVCGVCLWVAGYFVFASIAFRLTNVPDKPNDLPYVDLRSNLLLSSGGVWFVIGCALLFFS